MTMQLHDLTDHVHALLAVDRVRDWSPNGLQVEGRSEVRRIVTGVTACQALLDAAAQARADAVIVHHGWFWKGEPVQLTGMRRRRAATVLSAGYSLLAYHLPLDIHTELGNNAELGRRLGLQVEGVEAAGGIPDLLWYGRLDNPLSAVDLGHRIGHVLARTPLHLGPEQGEVQRVAWCTGAAHDLIDQAVALGVDAFITGEVAERTTHLAREQGLHCFAAGHHATERYGVQALGRHLAAHFGLEHEYIEIDNAV